MHLYDGQCNKTVHAFVDFLNQRWVSSLWLFWVEHLADSFDFQNKDKICYDIKACKDSLDDGVREFDDFFVNDDVDCKFCIYVNEKIKELMTGGQKPCLKRLSDRNARKL